MGISFCGYEQIVVSNLKKNSFFSKLDPKNVKL